MGGRQPGAGYTEGSARAADPAGSVRTCVVFISLVAFNREATMLNGEENSLFHGRRGFLPHATHSGYRAQHNSRNCIF